VEVAMIGVRQRQRRRTYALHALAQRLVRAPAGGGEDGFAVADVCVVRILAERFVAVLRRVRVVGFVAVLRRVRVVAGVGVFLRRRRQRQGQAKQQEAAAIGVQLLHRSSG